MKLRPKSPLAHRSVSRITQCLLLVVILLNCLGACGRPATPEKTGDISTAAASISPSPTSSATASVQALPSVPAAQVPSVEVRTATAETPTATTTSTHTPTPAQTSSPTATATSTPVAAPSQIPSVAPTVDAPLGTPAPTITPTHTITPTPTPTLTPTPLFTPTPVPTAVQGDNVVNILLTGLDSTANLRAQNTDVIMVVSVNKDTKQVSMLSIPRDLWVHIPTVGWSRINTAHRWGYLQDYPGQGPGLLMDTIEMHFGIPIDHWVRIDFKGFERVVDELGGIDITVACPVNLEYKPRPGGESSNRWLEPGVYHMDGATALRYVRTRRGGSDFDRARRQQQFLKAMWNQFKSPETILKIPGLWAALGDSFRTDLGLGDVLSLAPVALDVQPQRIRSRYIGAGQTSVWYNADGWSVLLPDYDKIEQVVASLYAPPSSREDEASVEGAKIRVLNGTYRHQLAKIGADDLGWQGLKVTETGLADNPDYAETQIIVFSERPKALELLVEVLQVRPRNVVHQPEGGQAVDLQVILGDDYDPCR